MKHAIFVTVIFAQCLRAGNIGTTPASNAASAIANVREFIRNRLNAPATAQFSGETLCGRMNEADFKEAAGLAPTPDCLPVTKPIGEGPDAVVYRGSLDAQNYVGAIIRTKLEVVVSFKKEGKWQFEDLAAAVKSSYSRCLERNSRALRDNTGRNEPLALEACGSQYPSVADGTAANSTAANGAFLPVSSQIIARH